MADEHYWQFLAEIEYKYGEDKDGAYYEIEPFQIIAPDVMEEHLNNLRIEFFLDIKPVVLPLTPIPGTLILTFESNARIPGNRDRRTKRAATNFLLFRILGDKEIIKITKKEELTHSKLLMREKISNIVEQEEHSEIDPNEPVEEHSEEDPNMSNDASSNRNDTPSISATNNQNVPQTDSELKEFYTKNNDQIDIRNLKRCPTPGCSGFYKNRDMKKCIICYRRATTELAKQHYTKTMRKEMRKSKKMYKRMKFREMMTMEERKMRIREAKLEIIKRMKMKYEEERRKYCVPDMSVGLIPNVNNTLPIFQIYIKRMDGETTTVDTSYTDSIYRIKEKIQYKEGVPLNDQRLIFQGRQLEDNRTLSDYNIKENFTLHLILRLRGD